MDGEVDKTQERGREGGKNEHIYTLFSNTGINKGKKGRNEPKHKNIIQKHKIIIISIDKTRKEVYNINIKQRSKTMTESKDQRKGWLKDLKVGDKVFIVSSKGVLGSVKTLAVVEKITPTGRLNVKGQQFPPSGSIYENYRSTKLEQATEQAIQEYVSNNEKQKLIKELTEKVNSGALNQMTLLDLKTIKYEFSKYE